MNHAISHARECLLSNSKLRFKQVAAWAAVCSMFKAVVHSRCSGTQSWHKSIL